MNMAKYFLGKNIENSTIWKFNLNPTDAKSEFKNNTFWDFLMYTWACFNFQTPQNYENITNEIVWMNSHIRVNN